MLGDADAVLVEVLGSIAADFRAQIERDIEHMRAELRAELRATVAEIKSAAVEALLAKDQPEAAARLKAIDGGRR